MFLHWSYVQWQAELDSLIRIVSIIMFSLFFIKQFLLPTAYNTLSCKPWIAGEQGGLVWCPLPPSCCELNALHDATVETSGDARLSRRTFLYWQSTGSQMWWGFSWCSRWPVQVWQTVSLSQCLWERLRESDRDTGQGGAGEIDVLLTAPLSLQEKSNKATIQTTMLLLMVLYTVIYLNLSVCYETGCTSLM